MKIFLSFLLLFTIIISGNATVHEVEVGGNQNLTPYYSPQNLTIEVGDTIHWNVVTGEHNMTSTSGPESFESGDISAPNDFEYVFTQLGIYDYECTLYDHSDTQFGTITVIASTIDVPETTVVGIEVFPIPASNVLNFSVDSDVTVATISLFNVNGELVINENIVTRINVSDLTAGVYFLILDTSKGIIRKKISVAK